MTTYNRGHGRNSVESGFTLLEVLIALLVMSIGLLGIGKMMMLSARANDSAYLRSQATALAYTMLDAMRANRSAAISQAYDTTQVVPAQLACATAAPGCTSGQVAQNDTALWNNAIAAELPPGSSGAVVTAIVPNANGANDVTATITVQWVDKVAEQSFGTPSAASASCAVGGCVSITLETVL